MNYGAEEFNNEDLRNKPLIDVKWWGNMDYRFGKVTWMQNPKEIEAVMKLPAPQRYEYFIKKVADWEEVWGLYEVGWAMVGDDEGNRLIPFWAKREFAEACALHDWKMYSPKSIPLDTFMEKWIPGMVKDKIKASISMTPGGQGVNVEPLRLLNDIENELENY